MARASQALKRQVFLLYQAGYSAKDILARVPMLSQATVYRYLKELRKSHCAVKEVA